MPQLSRFGLAFRTCDEYRRIVTVEFEKKDGSLYVIFPGFTPTTGLLSRPIMKAGNTWASIDLKRHGKITQHLPKCSFHTDGTTHFSKDGKILSTIRRTGVPLGQQEGHFFTLHIQDLSAFPRLDPSKRNQCRVDAPRGFGSLKVVGRRLKASELRLHEDISTKFDRTGLALGAGSKEEFFFAPPQGFPFDDFILVISVEAGKQLTPIPGPLLLFLAGFDPPAVAVDPNSDTEFLAMMFPQPNFAEIRGMIGTVDRI